nr:glycoside hydrolase family 9 protein [uncultured Draconibacterium sp.]
MPIKPSYQNALEYTWFQKEVLQSKLLSDMETMKSWEHEGYGTLTLSDEKSFKGKSSILIASPTKGATITSGRPWGVSSAIYTVSGEDWSDWNRISYSIYPDLPGFKVVSISMVFHNDGEEKVPGPYDRNGLNYQVLENQKWNKVYWEIEHLGRDKVTGVEIRYRLQGNEPGATDTAKYYIDELYLEKVKPDYYEGWGVAPGFIAHNNVGYSIGFPKVALVSNLPVSEFSLIDISTNETVLQKSIERTETPIGKFNVLDFSNFEKEGTYLLKTGDIHTKPFKIGTFENIYRSTIIKTINLFYTLRCGDDIPGVHSVCHRDWIGVHDDLSVIINGGWHDAGDLSQGLGNTAAATYSMFLLGNNIRESDPVLSARLIKEAKWGLDWMLKTRLKDGARFSFSTMDFWTDGIIGTIDDVPSTARINTQESFYCAKTEAMAAMVLMDAEPILANLVLNVAKEDWDIAMANIRRSGLDLYGAIVSSSVGLYEATADEKYKNAAIEFGDSIIACQQQNNLADDILLKGFFYRNTKKKDIQHYSHKSSEQEPIVALVQLCKTFPKHPDKGNWENAIRTYADYYKKITAYTDPYFMIPAGIYDITKARDEIEEEQIEGGVKLNDRYYLKSFPTWTSFRGNSGTTLSQSKGLAAIAKYLGDKDLLFLSSRVLDWHLGLNPFNQSLMYGEGYRYAGQYSVTSGNLVGGLPVGIQSHFNRDVPYWPPENCYNWKEIWVFPSSRWLWLLTDLYQ